MHFTTLTLVAIASAAFAMPANQAEQDAQNNDWAPGGGPWQPNQPNWNNNNNNGNNQGYRSLCTCQVNGQDQPGLGQGACDQLGAQWPNLQWDGTNCQDLDGIGLEQQGWEAACQRNGGPSDTFQPAAIRGSCSPY